MRQYIRTKVIAAMPMTMGKAYELKLLKEDIKPSECQAKEAGYFVDYGDGFKSWLPAEQFKKVYKVAETLLDSLRLEHAEESERYLRDSKFIDTIHFDKLDYLARTLLSAQNESQREYCYLLSDRITHMSNRLVVPDNYDFGTAIKLLKAGGAVRRAGWNGKGLFVVKQVPSHITADIIPNMQSLPQSAKDIIMARKEPHIDYTNQMLIINPDGRADSWVPSSSDVFAEDWELVTV